MGVSPFSLLGSGSNFFRSNEAKPLISISFMILSTICFVAVTVVVKFNGPVVPAAEAAFLRYIAGLVIIAPFLWSSFRMGSKKDLNPAFSSFEIFSNYGLIRHGEMALKTVNFYGCKVMACSTKMLRVFMRDRYSFGILNSMA